MIMADRSLGTLVVLLTSLVMSAQAFGQSNPGYMKLYAYIPVYEISTGQVVDILEVSEYITSGYGGLRTYNPYLPNYSPNDTHLTNPGSQKYGHGHAERDFPWVGRVNGTQPPSITVTSAMVDEAQLFDNPGHNIVVSATCAYNCHGLSMLKGHWVLAEILYGGAIVVVNAEYEPGTPPAADRFFIMESGTFGTFKHSYVGTFTAIGSSPIYALTGVIEKFNTGPIMTAHWTGASGGSTLQRKHK